MDERDLGGGVGGGTGDPGFSSAGSANTPSFESGSGGGATGGGRPPSHREFHEGTLGQGSTGGGSSTGGGATGVVGEAESRINETMSRAAEGLDSAARRLDELGDRYAGESGVRATAGNMAHQVADAVETTARYLRDNDVRSLQQSLERQVRENPLQTLLIGVAAGWIVGKILR